MTHSSENVPLQKRPKYKKSQWVAPQLITIMTPRHWKQLYLVLRKPSSATLGWQSVTHIRWYLNWNITIAKTSQIKLKCYQRIYDVWKTSQIWLTFYRGIHENQWHILNSIGLWNIWQMQIWYKLLSNTFLIHNFINPILLGVKTAESAETHVAPRKNLSSWSFLEIY